MYVTVNVRNLCSAYDKTLCMYVCSVSKISMKMK